MDKQTCPDKNHLLLYRAAKKGTFGEHKTFPRSSITDALFVYLDGEPEEVIIEAGMLRKFFAVFLLCMGIYEILKKEKK